MLWARQAADYGRVFFHGSYPDMIALPLVPRSG
jgi:hypothetical protein